MPTFGLSCSEALVAPRSPQLNRRAVERSKKEGFCNVISLLTTASQARQRSTVPTFHFSLQSARRSFPAGSQRGGSLRQSHPVSFYTGLAELPVTPEVLSWPVSKRSGNAEDQ